MSRTIRKRKEDYPDWLYDKHIVIKSGKKVTKTTTVSCLVNNKFIRKDRVYSYYPTYWLPMPKEEWTLEQKQKVRFHSDKWNKFRKDWVKRIWAKRRRQWDRRELFRTLNEEHEPTWFTSKIDTWWWD